MKDFTTEELKELDYFAGLLFCNDDLATIADVTKEEFRLAMMTESELSRTVKAARLKAEASIREGIIKMAIRGSTPAQNMADDLLKRLRKDNV